jgi:hypothetical protein
VLFLFDHEGLPLKMAKINTTYDGSYYIHPDFDPRQMPKLARDFEKPARQRWQLHFSIICGTCNSMIPKDKKLNCDVRRTDRKYHTLWIFSLTFHCPFCKSEVVMENDWENRDYVVVSGAERIHGDWKQDRDNDKAAKDSAKDTEGDATAALEKRVENAQRVYEEGEEIEDLYYQRAKHRKLSAEELLSAVRAKGASTARRDGTDDYEREMRGLEEEWLAQQQMAQAAKAVGEARKTQKGLGGGNFRVMCPTTEPEAKQENGESGARTTSVVVEEPQDDLFGGIGDY